jgi:hypothetical protein
MGATSPVETRSGIGEDKVFEMLAGGRLVPKRWSIGCGVDALYIGLAIIGDGVDYFELANQLGVTPRDAGVDLNRLLQVGRNAGAHCIAVRTKEKDLLDILMHNMPGAAIVHLRADSRTREHFVCVYVSNKGVLVMADPLSQTNSEEGEWQDRWDGVALLLLKKPFTKGKACSIAPRLALKNATYDGGLAEAGGTFQYELGFRNDGNATLTIQRVLSSCGCTEPRATKEVLAPGESARVVGTVKAGRTAGHQTAKIMILSNDIERPRADVIIEWDVKGAAAVVHPASMFLRVHAGEEKSQRIVVSPTTGRKLSDMNVESSVPWCRCKIDAAGDGVYVVVCPDWHEGRRSGVVRLSAIGAESVEVPVEVEVLPIVSVVPSQVFCRTDVGMSARILLRASTKSVAMNVREVALRDVPGHTSIEYGADGTAAVVVRFGPFNASGYAVGSIIVRMSDPHIPEITVPVYIWIREVTETEH